MLLSYLIIATSLLLLVYRPTKPAKGRSETRVPKLRI